MTDGARDSRLRGNDFLSVMPEITCRASMFLLFLDSRQKIAGMTEGALDPRLRGNDFLSVMPEIACRASMFLFFLDSRQKIAGMTEGALDSRQSVYPDIGID